MSEDNILNWNSFFPKEYSGGAATDKNKNAIPVKSSIKDLSKPSINLYINMNVRRVSVPFITSKTEGPIKDFARKYGMEMFKALPYADKVILIAKLANAFADGLIKGAKTVKQCIEPDFFKDPNAALTRKDIEQINRKRRYQWVAVSETFPKMIINGVTEVIDKFISEYFEDKVEGYFSKKIDSIFEEGVDILSTKFGDFLGDLLSGDYIKKLKLVSQDFEDLIEEIATIQAKLLYVTAVSELYDKAKEEVENATFSHEIPIRLQGYSPRI